MTNGKRDPNQRPSPEAFLAAAEQEGRGRLKIYLGAAPGVGKTYAMLEAAQVRKREGVDVVVGVVETHGRPETEALLDGLEVMPKRKVEYRGRGFEEMDLDAILARRPQLVLVDELAHTNIPGSRHAKRYLDVEEVLAAGVDVYTTLNIQHLESLNDTVAQITGIRVRETLPDRLLDEAAEVELVDLSPDELLQRLREGKVYVPEQAQHAIRRFFRLGNLNALRQLSLRRTAERVDEQMQTYMQAHAIPGPWPAGECILVCVSPSPLSRRLVRATRRMADRRHAEWMAVYVETPQHHRLSDADRDRVSRTLRLAEQLGGEAVTIPGEDVAEDLIKYAQSRNVTEIVIGKSLRSRWSGWWRGSIVNELIRKSGNIDVYVINTEDEASPHTGKAPVYLRPGVPAYVWSAGAVSVAAATAKLLQLYLPLQDLSLVFLTAVLFSAVTWGLLPSIFAAILSVLAYNFFFIPPLHTFSVASPRDLLNLAIFLIVAVLTSNLAARVRNQAEAAKRREARTAALYALSRQIAGAAELNDVLRAIVTYVAQVLGAKVVILLPEADRILLQAAHPANIELTEAERAAATWAWQHNRPAGRGADTLPGGEWFYLPLATARGTVGVLGLQFDAPEAVISPDQRRLLEALAGQAAVAIERTRLVREMEQARLLTETERLRDALLSTISHDLRTPLVSIIGAVSSLLTYGTTYDEATRRELLSTIQEEAERLNRFVGNLLDMMRLESGALELRREWVDIGDVIGTALSRLVHTLNHYQLVVDVTPDLPMLWIDFVLVEHVLVNLLENAAKYSPPQTVIRVSARREQRSIVVGVEDEGIGVPAADLERIFDKFYRVQRGDRQGAGTGLGLSICRGIMEAHGGRIFARSPGHGKGTAFVLTFPIEKEPPALTDR
ncbi:MAG: sensor histidine kinase KdpD [Candidatus Tectomicrobia bacterium]|nr:sensor histidine kinase KdpD [Candidatus Tectomicrobia bacterium]